MTPYEAWNGHKPAVAHLREFGSDVWVLDESNNRSKLGPRSKKMKLTGFLEGSKSIRYYDAAMRSIKVSRNFAFNENDELRELEIYTNLLGLQVEGEQRSCNDFENPKTPNSAPQQEVPLPETVVDTPKSPEIIPARPVREGRKSLDYRKLNNPSAQPDRKSVV